MLQDQTDQNSLMIDNTYTFLQRWLNSKGVWE